jgi:hypothetical protein
MAAPSTHVRNSNYGRLEISDGSATPVTLVIPYIRGDFKLGPLPPVLNEVVKHRARGKRISESYGEKIDPAVSFSADLTSIIGANAVSPGSLAEFLAQQGAYSALVPTSGAASGRPKTWNLKWITEGAKLVTGDGEESVLCRDFHGRINIEEGEDGNTLSVEGEVWGSITVTNGSNTVTYQQMT